MNDTKESNITKLDGIVSPFLCLFSDKIEVLFRVANFINRVHRFRLGELQMALFFIRPPATRKQD